MTGSQTEIEDKEHKTEESSTELSQNENERPSSYQSEVDISYNGEDEEDTFITEKFIKEHKRNLEKRVNNLKTTIEILRKQLNEEKALWKKEFEEYNKIQTTDIEDTTTVNLTESSTDTSYLGTGDHQQKFPLQQDSSTFIQKQAEQKAILWRTIAMAEYQRRLLEVESMCNLELIRVKQSVQSLQPLQRLVSEWSDQTNENSNKSEVASAKSTVTIGTENDDTLDNTKESKSEEEIKMDKDAMSPITPRSKIYNDFSEVCAKMQNFMMNLPVTASVLASKDSNSAKAQSAVWYSAYSFH